MSIIKLKNNTLKSPNSETEHIYYNISINNQTTNSINAVFSESRSSAILDNCSDYQLSIIRFSVPVKNIPLMILNNNLYKLTYSYDGLDVPTTVAWSSNSNNPQKQNYIYNPQEFVDAVNIALLNGFNSIKTLKPAFPATVSPYFVIDGDLVNFCAQTTMTNQLYFNKPLKNMFNTLSFIENYNGDETNLKYYQIVIKNNSNNTIPSITPLQYKMVSSSSILPLWSDFQALVIATSMPVNSELLGAQNDKRRIVLTDFEATLNDKSPLRYYPQGPLRYYDFISKIALMAVDVALYWESNKTNQLYPIILEQGDTATIKIMFEHKKTRNDYITYN